MRYIEINVDIIVGLKDNLFGFLVVTDITEEKINDNVIQNITEQDFDYIGYIDIASKKFSIVAATQFVRDNYLHYGNYDEQLRLD